MSEFLDLISLTMNRAQNILGPMVFDNPAIRGESGSRSMTFYEYTEPPRTSGDKLQPFTVVRLPAGSVDGGGKGKSGIYVIILSVSIWSWDEVEGSRKILEVVEQFTKLRNQTDYSPYKLIPPIDFAIGDALGEQIAPNIFEAVVKLTFDRATIFKNTL